MYDAFEVTEVFRIKIKDHPHIIISSKNYNHPDKITTIVHAKIQEITKLVAKCTTENLHDALCIRFSDDLVFQ